MAMKSILAAELDPLLAAAQSAPLVEATPEEMAAFEEGLVDIRAGRTASAARIRAQLEARERE